MIPESGLRHFALTTCDEGGSIPTRDQQFAHRSNLEIGDAIIYILQRAYSFLDGNVLQKKVNVAFTALLS